MKKLIVLALFALSAVQLLTGCSNNEPAFTQKSYEADGTQIKEIRMDVKDRKIEVSSSKDQQIHIRYFENDKEFYDISVSDDTVLTMTAASDKTWSDYIGRKPAAQNRKISLQVPDSLMESLSLSTTNEDIRLSPLHVTKELSLSANGGNISFREINAGNSITLTAKNGDISGSIIGGLDDYAIACTIKKGESNLPSDKKGGSKTLSVQANNGDVEIDFQNR